ncbi:MAG: zinc metallopeptidase [Deltaproteobacteria bacterium]|nr:zinc metallopeptidase [Deltaproteobacteria bacterium]
MKWTPGTENDDVIDVRGSSDGGGGGGGLILGGGGIAATIIVVLVSRLAGVDLSGLFQGRGHTEHKSAPPAGTDADAQLVGFVKFVMKDIQDTFDGKFKREGLSYRRAKLIIFSRAVNTGCGRSSSAIGPFYCPPDEKAYIDLTFFRDLRDRFKAAGDYAQAYVLAHEIGHHLQKILGAEAKARRFRKNEGSVRIELQADCYAGVWGHSTSERKLLDPDDLEEALRAANAIGDDRLQKEAGRAVNPETFTHGTSAQRMRWFKRGFESGRLDACDTFSAGSL